MEPFKNKYNLKDLKRFSSVLDFKEFDQNKFIKLSSNKLNTLEMKDRVRQISKSMSTCFSCSYEDSIDLIVSKLDEVKDIDSFWIWPLTNYVANFGIEHMDKSAFAMCEMTKRFSSEFVIRHFINKYGAKFYKKYIIPWSKSDNEHLRRLASEGTRPNLPWGIKVPYINNNLEENIKILNRLKNDESLYVRKSVANHFNDITRVNPKIVLTNFEKWNSENLKQAWIIKHALRTLLKKGDSKALKLVGFSINPKIKIENKKLSKKRIREGDSFDLSFTLISDSKKEQKLSIDYIIHYPKKNHKISKKVFKLKDVLLKDKIELKKTINFKKVTTRVHYPGVHKVELKVSNKIYEFGDFSLD